MSIIDDVKSVAKTVQQIDNIELYRKILDLQGEILNLLEQNASMRKEIAALEDKFRIKQALKYEKGVYWIAKVEGGNDGPFCTQCWDASQLLIRLLNWESVHKCPKCGTAFDNEGFDGEPIGVGGGFYSY